MDQSQLSNKEKDIIKGKCFDFLKVLATKLLEKVPSNLNMLNKMKLLSPNICLNSSRPLLKDVFPLELKDANVKLDDLDSQWRNLLNIHWDDYFVEGISEDPVVCWTFVLFFKNAGGQLVFKELAQFALKLLSLPLSNAVVERVFSVMNIVKTKTRNKLVQETLDSILMLRIFLNNHGICCTNFVATNKMYELFNYHIYDSTSILTEEEQELEEVLEFVHPIL